MYVPRPLRTFEITAMRSINFSSILHVEKNNMTEKEKFYSFFFFFVCHRKQPGKRNPACPVPLSGF